MAVRFGNLILHRKLPSQTWEFFQCSVDNAFFQDEKTLVIVPWSVNNPPSYPGFYLPLTRPEILVEASACKLTIVARSRPVEATEAGRGTRTLNRIAELFSNYEQIQRRLFH